VENTFGKDWQGLFRISPGCGRSEWHGIFRKGSAPHGIWISFFWQFLAGIAGKTGL